jgi:hypothetical protein
VDPAEIDQRVHDTYDTLKEGASIESHLVAVTENVVTGELLSEGADLRSRTQDPE